MPEIHIYDLDQLSNNGPCVQIQELSSPVLMNNPNRDYTFTVHNGQLTTRNVNSSGVASTILSLRSTNVRDSDRSLCHLAYAELMNLQFMSVRENLVEFIGNLKELSYVTDGQVERDADGDPRYVPVERTYTTSKMVRVTIWPDSNYMRDNILDGTP